MKKLFMVYAVVSLGLLNAAHAVIVCKTQAVAGQEQVILKISETKKSYSVEIKDADGLSQKAIYKPVGAVPNSNVYSINLVKSTDSTANAIMPQALVLKYRISIRPIGTYSVTGFEGERTAASFYNCDRQ